MGNSWTAHCHDEYSGFSLAQLNQKAGHKSKFQSEGKSNSKSRAEHYPKSYEVDDVSDLPS